MTQKRLLLLLLSSLLLFSRVVVFFFLQLCTILYIKYYILCIYIIFVGSMCVCPSQAHKHLYMLFVHVCVYDLYNYK